MMRRLGDDLTGKRRGKGDPTEKNNNESTISDPESS